MRNYESSSSSSSSNQLNFYCEPLRISFNLETFLFKGWISSVFIQLKRTSSGSSVSFPAFSLFVLYSELPFHLTRWIEVNLIVLFARWCSSAIQEIHFYPSSKLLRTCIVSTFPSDFKCEEISNICAIHHVPRFSSYSSSSMSYSFKLCDTE